MRTEGHHYYIDRKNNKWKEAFQMILDRIHQIQESIGANAVLLRDFDKNDIEFKNFFVNEGFAPIDMPNANIVDKFDWSNQEEFINTLSYKNRKHFRKDIKKYEDYYEVEYKNELSIEEAEYFYDLYINVEHSNRGFNMFDYPKDILKKLSKHPNWEFLILKLKPEVDSRKERKAVAVLWYYVGNNHVTPIIIGIDYKFNIEFRVYKQMIWQLVKRAKMLAVKKIFMGLSADTEKRKCGALQYSRVAYVQTKDNYNMEVIESMAALPAQELA